MSKPLKINVPKAIEQKLKGMSYQEIAESQHTCKSAVFAAISPILKQFSDPDVVKQYRADTAAILDGLAANTVASITNEDFSKASLQQKVVSVGILIDKSRLIQGQSTSNSSIMLKAIMSTMDAQTPVDNSE